jgi:tyrosyl-tRNA synthetase
MSVSDELMARYYELLLRRAAPTGKHPLDAKKDLAFEIVQTYHSLEAATKASDEWTMRFSKRDLEHADLPGYSPTAGPEGTVVGVVSDIYRKVFLVDKSRSEISRLIKQGSVEINETKITDPLAIISLHPGQIVRLDRKHAVRIH